jgi:hypothetical protein
MLDERPFASSLTRGQVLALQIVEVRPSVGDRICETPEFYYPPIPLGADRFPHLARNKRGIH